MQGAVRETNNLGTRGDQQYRRKLLNQKAQETKKNERKKEQLEQKKTRYRRPRLKKRDVEGGKDQVKREDGGVGEKSRSH